MPEVTPAVRAHLEECPKCAAYANDWRFVQKGLQSLAAETGPLPLPGFAARVVERLQQAAANGFGPADFFEQAGRRFVYASVTAAVTLLLMLTLTVAGSFRESAAELAVAQQEEIAIRTDPLLAAELGDLWEFELKGNGNHVPGESK